MPTTTFNVDGRRVSLNFGGANAKLIGLQKLTKKKLYTFSTLSGFTCPYARECDSRAVVDNTGKRHILDGPHTKFRCFSASQEVMFTNVYNSRKANMDIIAEASRDVPTAARLLSEAIPKNAGIIRISIGGDFGTKAYFQSWLMAAHANPKVHFYSYTKSLPFWIWAKEEDIIPDNFILTASYGGHRDDLIEKYNLRYTKVVYSVKEARQLKLPIDNDDRYACLPKYRDTNFSLLIHGGMPKGSDAGKAVRALKGKGSYSRKRLLSK